MLSQPHLVNKCCSTEHINNILGSIDKTIRNISVSILNNIRYGLTNEICEDTFQDLLLYRNIIVSKLLGNEVLEKTSWDLILSRVKKIINKH